MPDRLRVGRRSVIGVVATAVVLGAAGSAWALTSGDATAYRTAAVTRGTVTQMITTTGTITPVRSADLDFQVAGTVAKVLVTQGQRVLAGQRVAVLESSSLRAAVRTARSTLADARAALVTDEDSQTATASTSTTQSTPTAAPSPTATAAPRPTTSPASGAGGSGTVSRAQLARIKKDQANVLAATRTADTDLATAKADLAAETTACKGSSTDTAGTAGSADTADCVAATTRLFADQQAVAADQAAVAKAEAALTADLGSATSTRTGTGSGSVTAANLVVGTRADAVEVVTAADVVTTPSPSGQSSRSTGSTGSTSSTGGTVTAATLAADQATIDSDRAALATARADRRQSVLRTSISGRVAAVTIIAGQQVSGSSSTTSPAVEVMGSEQRAATVQLTAAQVRTVRAGMTATVIPDGASAEAGNVVAIGEATTDSSTGDVTYPVTVAMSARSRSLVTGAAAQVSIVLAAHHQVVAVPTSAVHHSGTESYVEVDRAGHVTRQSVTIGAVGADLTQVRSGLVVAQRVVLADLGAAVPSSSSNLLDTGSRPSGGSFTNRGPVGGAAGGPLRGGVSQPAGG